MNGQHQFVTVADEGHLGLAEAPQVLHAGVVLGHLEVEIVGIVGVLQLLAVGILIGLLHLVGIVDEAGEQGQVCGLLADLLGEQTETLIAVLVLLNDLPPVVDGLAIGERLGVVIPERLRSIQRIAVLQVGLVQVGADVAGIEGLDDALVVPLIEDAAVDVLGLQHVGGDVATVMLDLGLVQHFVGVQVGNNNIQAGIHLFEGLLSLHHLGGGSVNIDGDIFLQGLLIELVIGHVAPLIPIGAIELLAGLGVNTQVQGGLRSLLAALRGSRSFLLLTAGSQAQDHDRCQQQRKKLLHLHRVFSFRFENM